jgi:hypothetical protein
VIFTLVPEPSSVAPAAPLAALVFLVPRCGPIVQFGNEWCTSRTANCSGSLNSANGWVDQSLGTRPDGEVMLLGNNGIRAVYTGFDPSPSGTGLLAAYLTGYRDIDPSFTCPSSTTTPATTQALNRCPTRANGKESAVVLTDYAGWQPHDMGPGLCVWVFGLGVWIGDRTCVYSADRHLVRGRFVAGSHCAGEVPCFRLALFRFGPVSWNLSCCCALCAPFAARGLSWLEQTSFNILRNGRTEMHVQRGKGLSEYINSTGSFGVYWRSKSYTTAGAASSITKGGAVVSSGQAGLNVVAFKDDGCVCVADLFPGLVPAARSPSPCWPTVRTGDFPRHACVCVPAPLICAHTSRKRDVRAARRAVCCPGC